jgi:hypothetical protein
MTQRLDGMLNRALRSLGWLVSNDPIFKENWGRLDLHEGESLVHKGVVATRAGTFGNNNSPLVLTSLRLIWNPWNAKHVIEIPLAEIESVDTGLWLERTICGPRIRVKVRGGKKYRFMTFRGDRDVWLLRLRAAVGPMTLRP